MLLISSELQQGLSKSTHTSPRSSRAYNSIPKLKHNLKSSFPLKWNKFFTVFQITISQELHSDSVNSECQRWTCPAFITLEGKAHNLHSSPTSAGTAWQQDLQACYPHPILLIERNVLCGEHWTLVKYSRKVLVIQLPTWFSLQPSLKCLPFPPLASVSLLFKITLTYSKGFLDYYTVI